jgi:hypothetical protein
MSVSKYRPEFLVDPDSNDPYEEPDCVGETVSNESLNFNHIIRRPSLIDTNHLVKAGESHWGED